MAGWKGSDRLSRLPADWPKIRNKVKKRDGYRCTHINERGERCIEDATDVDHIRPGDDHSLDNLRSLCSWHHLKKSGSEGAAARAAVLKRNSMKFKRVEKHPGLM